MQTLEAVLNEIRSRVETWREAIRSASCEEYMPGALADAIEAHCDALHWLKHNEDYFTSQLKDDLPIGEYRALAIVIRYLWFWQFRIKEDLKCKAAEYRQKMLCRTPVGVLMDLYPADTWKSHANP